MLLYSWSCIRRLGLPQCFALKLLSMITSALDPTPNGTVNIVRTNSMSHGWDGFLDEIAKYLFFVYFFVCFFIWQFSLALVFWSHGQVLLFYPLLLKTELFLTLVRFLYFHVPFTVSWINCKKEIVFAKVQFDKVNDVATQRLRYTHACARV